MYFPCIWWEQLNQREQDKVDAREDERVDLVDVSLLVGEEVHQVDHHPHDQALGQPGDKVAQGRDGILAVTAPYQVFKVKDNIKTINQQFAYPVCSWGQRRQSLCCS